MRFVVYVEVEEDGSAMAHVPSLPGCISTGLNEEIALSRLPQAITDYLGWLKAHGERVPDQVEPIELEVGGISGDTGTGHPGDADATFPPDRTPMTEQEVAALLRLLNYSRQELIQTVAGLPNEVMNWKPGSGDSGEVWDIDDILEHIASSEQFYISRLSTNVMTMLDETRKAAVERLAALDDTGRSQIVEHAGDLWTARKIFRRMLEHEREHIRHIESILDRFKAAQGIS
jgi:predicted RNase H-like HicB family nuclease